jgi:hypothetical protein
MTDQKRQTTRDSVREANKSAWQMAPNGVVVSPSNSHKQNNATKKTTIAMAK